MLKYLIYDTETTGLHIITDKPFLIPYGLVDENLNLVSTEMFDADDMASRAIFINHLKNIKTIVGHNIKFDIHMAINNGIDIDIFKDKNYIDTSVLARLVIPHDTQIDKTFSTSLKKLAMRYLGVDSADEEHKLKAELSRLTIEHKQKLKDYLVDKNVWPTNLNSTQETTVLNNIYNKWTKVFHKYPNIKQHRIDFYKLYPAPTYQDVSNVRTYAMTDIILTHGLFKLWYKEVVKLDQVPTLMRISKVTFPLMLMERKGMTVDVQQLLSDRNKLLKEFNKTKIIDPRTNTELKIGQHAKLKELYEYESGMYLTGADKNVRAEIEDASPAAKAANYISKMDKYLSTYITGILRKLTPVDNQFKVYTQYNLAGTITGRLSSDFQQFPKDPLVLNDGTEINIRSWFIVPPDNKYIFYFDYSQMELRLQCEWTNIVNGEPDINMARAFSPFKCFRTTLTGLTHEFQNDPDWRQYKWYLNEDPKTEWQPVDLHGLTTKNAFPNIDESDPDWKHYRQLGKRTNFAVNYGASAAKIQEALKVDFDMARALVAGYKQAFAGVVDFNKWISRRVYVTDNIPNLLLRRYYARNKHLLLNWLVQGSGADILLEKTREVYDYIKDKPWWNLMISVHDEMGLTCDDIPEAQLIKEVKDIQTIMTYKLSAVDVTSDVEYTQTKWSEKLDWEGKLNEI